MERILVTGATSMLGVALIKAAIRHNVEVYAMVRKNNHRMERLPKSNLLTLIYGDISALEDNISDLPVCDTFFHFAWCNTDRLGRNDAAAQSKNIEYTLNAVQAARKLGCKRFIGAGSQAEYGPVDGIISEETPCHPETAYGIAKYAAGRLAEKQCSQLGLEYIWGRIFSVYGVNDNEGTMLNYAIDQFIKGETAEFSAGTQMWNYLNEKDAGEIFYRLGESRAAEGVVCVAGTESKPLKEYIQLLRSLMQAETNASFAAEKSKEKVYGLEANTEKLRKLTGFKPGVSFQQGISEVIAYRKNLSRRNG